MRSTFASARGTVAAFCDTAAEMTLSEKETSTTLIHVAPANQFHHLSHLYNTSN
jgi:hypothetical protein